MKRKNLTLMAIVVIIFFFLSGVILIIDQLYLFGVPFGPFLPDMSGLDPTGSELIHHWMFGVGLVVFGFLMLLFVIVATRVKALIKR